MKLRNLEPRGRSLASKAGSATHMKPAEHHLGAEYLKTSSCSLDRGQSASCGYADESELNSSETKASINTPNCRVGV